MVNLEILELPLTISSSILITRIIINIAILKLSSLPKSAL